MKRAEETLKAAEGMICDALEHLTVKCIPELASMVRDCCELRKFIDKHYIEDETAWLLSRIDSELSAADMYGKQWSESDDAAIKQIALDEMRHAKLMLDKIKAMTLTDKQQAHLQELIGWQQELTRKLQ